MYTYVPIAESVRCRPSIITQTNYLNRKSASPNHQKDDLQEARMLQLFPQTGKQILFRRMRRSCYGSRPPFPSFSYQLTSNIMLRPWLKAADWIRTRFGEFSKTPTAQKGPSLIDTD